MSTSDSLVSYISTRVAVAGTAMATRMARGIMVQRISTTVFSWKLAGLAPWDLRWAKIDQNMTPNTTTPMATQIQRMVMRRLKIWLLVPVTPGDIFMVQSAMTTAGDNRPAARATARLACTRILCLHRVLFLSDFASSLCGLFRSSQQRNHRE